MMDINKIALGLMVKLLLIVPAYGALNCSDGILFDHQHGNGTTDVRLFRPLWVSGRNFYIVPTVTVDHSLSHSELKLRVFGPGIDRITTLSQINGVIADLEMAKIDVAGTLSWALFIKQSGANLGLLRLFDLGRDGSIAFRSPQFEQVSFQGSAHGIFPLSQLLTSSGAVVKTLGMQTQREVIICETPTLTPASSSLIARLTCQNEYALKRDIAYDQNTNAFHLDLLLNSTRFSRERSGDDFHIFTTNGAAAVVLKKPELASGLINNIPLFELTVVNHRPSLTPKFFQGVDPYSNLAIFGDVIKPGISSQYLPSSGGLYKTIADQETIQGLLGLSLKTTFGSTQLFDSLNAGFVRAELDPSSGLGFSHFNMLYLKDLKSEQQTLIPYPHSTLATSQNVMGLTPLITPVDTYNFLLTQDVRDYGGASVKRHLVVYLCTR